MSAEVAATLPLEQGGSTHSETTKQNAIPLEGKELREAIKKQVEYYFSKENLVTDRYLVSQMNSETYVPIKIIANFKQIRNLTTDLELLTSVMKECNGIELDSSLSMIKPSIKPHRNTLILREIPSSTPLSEVKGIFEQEGHGKVAEIKGEIGDMWYVSFQTDEDALKSLDKLRNQTFQDKPIRCRLKTESTFRSISLSATNIPMPIPVEAADKNFVGGVFYPGVKQSGEGQTNNRKGGRGNGSGNGRRNGTSNSSSTSSSSKKNQKNQPKTAAEVTAPRKRSTSRVELGVNNFPPLQGDGKSGYTEPFLKWNREDFLETLSGVSGEVPKPEGLNLDAKEASSVILSTPSKELELNKPRRNEGNAKSAWEQSNIERVMSPPPKPAPVSKVSPAVQPKETPKEKTEETPKEKEEKKENSPNSPTKEKENVEKSSTGPAAGTWASVLANKASSSQA